MAAMRSAPRQPLIDTPSARFSTPHVCRATRVAYDAVDTRQKVGSDVVVSSNVVQAAGLRVRNTDSETGLGTLPGPLQPHASPAQAKPAQRTSHQRRLDPRQLTALITRCEDWSALQALVQQHAQDLNSLHLSALVVRLAKIESAQTLQAAVVSCGALDSFLQDVSMLVSRNFDAFDPRALANVLWAVAKLGFRPSYTLLQRYLFATYLSMPLMRAQELANLAWAAAHMRLHPGVDWLTRFYQTIHRQADSMRPQELANTAWALAQLAGDAGLTAASDAAVSPGSPQGAGVEPATSSPMATARDAAWLQLQRGMLRGLAGFKPSELMMALVALHGQDRLGWSGCNRQQLRELLCAAGPHLAAGAARMSQQDLCQCACILAWSVRGQGGGVHSNSWSTPEVQGGLRSVCSAIMQHTLHALPHLPFKSLVRLGWALAELHCVATPAWLARYTAALVSHLTPQPTGIASTSQPSQPAQPAQPGSSAGISQPQSLVVAMWALARLHTHAHTQSKSSTVSAQGAESGQADALQTGEMGSARVGFVAELPAALQAAVADALPRLTLPQLARLVWSLGQLRSAGAAPLQQALAATLSGHIKLRLTRRTAAAAAAAGTSSAAPAADTAAASGWPAQAVASVTEASESTTDSVTEKHITMLLAGMSQLQLPNPPALLVSLAHCAARTQPAVTTAAASPSQGAAEQYRLLWRLLRQVSQTGGSEGTKRRVLSILLACIVQQPHMLAPQQACQLLRLAVQLGATRLDLRARAVLVERAATALPALPPAAAVSVLVCMARTGLPPNPIWLGRCLQWLGRVMPRLSFKDMSNVLWCMATWGVFPSMEWMQLCLDNLAGALNHTLAQRASIQARADPHVRRAIVWSDRGTAAAATRSLWALKRMHVVVPVLKDKLTQVALASVVSLSPSEALTLLRVVVASRNHLLRSEWRKLLSVCTRAPRPTGPPSSTSRAKQAQRAHAHAVRHVLSEGHVRWMRQWPTWKRLKLRLESDKMRKGRVRVSVQRTVLSVSHNMMSEPFHPP